MAKTLVTSELVNLYRTGISLEAIARRFGVCHETVRKRLLREGEPRRPAHGPAGERHWNWRGGRFRFATGYVGVSATGYYRSGRSAWVREHRLVVERHLGRRLRPDEHVHHLNGLRHDNRIENLQVLSNRDHPRRTLVNILYARIRNLEAQIRELQR